MSIRGEINKISGDVKRSIRSIAQGGMTGIDGCVRGTRKILGYVCAIHEDGELAGTIDVQEFNYDPGEYEVDGVGHHSGVRLSAIQNNEEGYLIVPMLYSEVIITQNPLDGMEYVLMYSHARQIRLTASSVKGDDGTVEIGVTEKESFVETDDGLEKDYNELEPTGNKTSTIYDSTAITDHVTASGDDKGYTEQKTASQKTITVGDTKIIIDGSSITIETGSEVKIKTTNASIETTTCEVKGSDVKVNGSQVTITGGTLKTQGVGSTDMNGPYNPIKACPYSGAPHCGSTVSGT